MASMAAKEETAILFFLALFLFSSMVCEAKVDTKQNPLRTDDDDDYFLFVLQWPPSVCSNLTVSCATGYEKRFTIGGFKPQPYPYYPCSGPPFDISKIEHIQPQLGKVWYDFVFDTNVSNALLWENAWENYGVCSCSEFDQTNYFELALNIKNNRNYNVLDIVQSVGISPRESNPLWGRDRFYNAIYWRLGKEPILRCNTNKFTRSIQLVQVILCFAEDGIELIDCPDYYMNNCPSSFTWPTSEDPPPPPPPPPSLSPPPPSLSPPPPSPSLPPPPPPSRSAEFLSIL